MEKFRLAGEIRRLNNLIKRYIDADEIFARQKDVTGTHGYILGFVRRKSEEGEPVYQKNIEQAFSIRRSSATEILNAMEQNGLLMRVEDESDKRMKKIVLTQKGMDVHTKTVERLDFLDKKLIAELSENELEVLQSVINKLKNKLDY